MNIAVKFSFYFFLLLLNIPLNFYSQTSWHAIEAKFCSWDSKKKEWKDCQSFEEEMTFYFNAGISKVNMIDSKNEIRRFTIKDNEPYDEEKKQIDFNIISDYDKELKLRIDFDDKYITMFDLNSDNYDEWKLIRFSIDQSIAYGNFISDEIEVSEWDYQKETYVNVSEGLSWEFYVDIDFNSLTLENKNLDSSKVNIDMEYTEFDSKDDWVLFESTSSEDVKVYVFSGNENISLYIYSDLVDGRYQKLMSLSNFNEIEDSEKISKRNSIQEKKSDSWTGTGSGIIFSTDGYIATNYHVIENANEIEVEFKNRGKIRKFNAEVIKSDPTNDLAIIKINDDSFEELPTLLYNFKTKTSDIGQSVFALGYPKSKIMGTDLKFTDGKISSRTGVMGDVTNYQTTTPIQSGNSGGPLFDTDGNLIAINSSKMVAEDIDNVSYSIKTIYLIPLIDALPEDITLPNSKFLQAKDFTEQFKVLEKYVTLIRVK